MTRQVILFYKKRHLFKRVRWSSQPNLSYHMKLYMAGIIVAIPKIEKNIKMIFEGRASKSPEKKSSPSQDSNPASVMLLIKLYSDSRVTFHKI
jgi:hypothetical protein